MFGSPDRSGRIGGWDHYYRSRTRVYRIHVWTDVPRALVDRWSNVWSNVPEHVPDANNTQRFVTDSGTGSVFLDFPVVLFGIQMRHDRGTFGRPDDRPAHVLRSFGKTGIRVFGISAAHFNTTEVTSNVLRYFHEAKA